MNLSSSDEDSEDGYSSNDEDIATILHQQQQDASTSTSTNSKDQKMPAPTVAAHQRDMGTHNHSDSDSASDSEGFDDIEWEDASIGEQDSKMPPEKDAVEKRFPSRDVVINFNDADADGNDDDNVNVNINDSISKRGIEGKKSKSNTRKRRRLNKIKDAHVPLNMQHLLRDLQRSHMLASVSRSIFLSSMSVLRTATATTEDDILWSIAYSVIPPEFLDNGDDDNDNDNDEEKSSDADRSCIVPTYPQLQRFSLWFFDYVDVRMLEQRRQIQHRSNIAAGAGARAGATRSRTRRKSRRGNRKAEMEQESGNGVDVSTRVDNNKHASMREKLVRIMAYLSPTNDDHPDPHAPANPSQDVGNISITPLEKVILFICITRSMRWRVRFVTSFDPMPTDLTPNHPIFATTMKHTFQSIVNSMDTTRTAKKKKRKKVKQARVPVAKKPDPQVSLDDGSNPSHLSHSIGVDGFVWVEVLCSKTATATRSGRKGGTSQSLSDLRWTHVDPSRKYFDKPLQVELLNNPNKTKKVRRPFSYVVGVEHFHNLPDGIIDNEASIVNNNLTFYTTRVVDITPRYANRWSLTLKRRGANAKEIATGKCSNRWWSKTLKRLNNSFIEHRRRLDLSAVCMDKKKNATTIKMKDKSPYKIEKQRFNEKEEEVLIIDNSSDEEQGDDVKSEDNLDDLEEQEFSSAKEKEAIPTSKAAFKNHPLYVIPSVLKVQEVLAPDAKKRICGIFKGEMVYKRKDVSKAYTAKKWLYEGRKVLDRELKRPTKVVKARKKPVQKGFQALSSYGTTTEIQDAQISIGNTEEDDGKNKLYGIFQTEKWSPPYVGPNDDIPISEHKNIELALLNPGLVHLELYRLSKVAKQLGVPYAPCLIGFEGHGGNRTPTIRGIVVHRHNEDLLREAHVEMQSQLVEKEYKERQRNIYGKWKRLIKGTMTKERLAREYAND